MSTALGKFLILNVAAGQASIFQLANRSRDVFRTAETSVRIDNCRNSYGIRTIAGEPDDLRHRQQPDVRHAGGSVRHSRAADIHGVKTRAFHLPRYCSVRHAGQHHATFRD